MTSRRVLPLATFFFGIVAGAVITARSMQVVQAASIEQDMNAIQAARGAMDLIQYDMERAGYAQTASSSRVSIRISHQDRLEMVAVSPKTVAFRSADGSDNIMYRFESGQLTRTVSGRHQERLVLLNHVSAYKIKQVSDEKTINLAFWIPVGGRAQSMGVQAPVYGHFVRSSL